MLLDLSEIVIRDGMHVELDVDQPGVEDPDLHFVEPLRGHLAFENSGDLINIHGKVAAVLNAACGRCLTDVTIRVPVSVDEHFPIADILNPTRQPEEDEDFDTTISTTVYLDQGRPVLDLDELLRQLILAEVPMIVVCKEECAGLCPRCGANRNDAACNCADENANKPLAKLAALLNEDGVEG